uniref:cancer/testis antigen 55 n=1 Tax=Jaculus jaculus TaxID=51337 RepID=UPI00064D290E|nr:cancer/testis antigen 55 [Jaculus jaculus]
MAGEKGQVVAMDSSRTLLITDILNPKTVIGVVTSLFVDYGWIDECIFFSTDVVIGNVPPKRGQKVSAFVEEDKISHGLNAIAVYAFFDDFDFHRPPNCIVRALSGCVSRVKEDTVYIANEYHFYLDSISKAILGFKPYKGDWLDIDYTVNHRSSKINIYSLKATKRRHLDEVCITAVNKKCGVVDRTIFYTLESVDIPDDYFPLLGDVVNVVVVQSIRPHYNWRAISITPMT